ncbi:MAG TPA: cupin domain-containing protein [Rhodanobacteraceae bacterium]|jgi:anti-sigma factor ChrR (cupin superfamily)|nr:cupin domain-containing protein [Rhodanobacteraceae bacterium]
MSTGEEDGFRRKVDVAAMAWCASQMTARVEVKNVAETDGLELQVVRMQPGAAFPAHRHDSPEFIYILEGELVQNGERLAAGWASVSGAGTADRDVHTETGCTFLLVDRPYHPDAS